MTQQPGFAARVRTPPPSGNPALDQWLREVMQALNALPRLSWFSGVSPNTSAITGTAGDIVINLASASTQTRCWVMGGAVSYSTTTGWRPLMVASIV